MRLKSLVTLAPVSTCAINEKTSFRSGVVDCMAFRSGAMRPFLRLSPMVLPGIVSAVLVGAAVQQVAAQSLQPGYIINTIAGTGVAGFSGDGSQALAAQLNGGGHVATDSNGNLFFADTANNRIRKIGVNGVITTVGGTGTACAAPTAATNPCGDNGQATAATLNAPYSLYVDSANNIYFDDYGDYRIRKITVATGVITTLAGTGTTGNNNNVQGTALNMASAPDGLVVDGVGNVYFACSGANIVYKLTIATGVVTEVLTNANSGQSQVNDLAVDTQNNLYAADQGNNRILKLAASNAAITTIVGTGAQGYTGDGGAANAAKLNDPDSLIFDGQGDLIFLDRQNGRIRKVAATTGVISTASIITTIAGNGTDCADGAIANAPCGDGGPAILANLNSTTAVPNGIGFNRFTNATYYFDSKEERIRVLNTPGEFPATNVGASSTQVYPLVVTGAAVTIAANGITAPIGPNGNPEYAVTGVTGCTTDGTTSNPVGTICLVTIKFTPSYPGQQAAPLVVVTSGGKQQFGLTGTGMAPQAVLDPGMLGTIAGTGTAGGTGNGGRATAATLSQPRGLTFDASGNFYITDRVNNEIRKVTTGGVISIFAGGGATNYRTNPGGAATAAALNAAESIRFDAAGNAIIADYANHLVARIDAVTGNITPFAGNGTNGSNTIVGDGGAATSAQVSGPDGIAIDPNSGNVYIADGDSGTIRLVNVTTGLISTIAGTGTWCTTTGACGDNGPATSAQLHNPHGLILDGKGNLYVADTLSNRIRVINLSTGIISTVIGSGAGTAGYTGDGAAAGNATLNNPYEIVSDAAGDIYIADSGNNAVRMVQSSTGNFTTGIINTVVGNGTACATAPAPSCGDGGPSNVSALSFSSGVALDVSGDIYASSEKANLIKESTVNPIMLAFATTTINNTSTDSPKTAYLENIGNSALTLSVPTAGTNPSVSTGFAAGSAGTCPSLATTSTAGTLATGAQCSYSISFTPTVVGAITGQLVESDNSLNSTTATQTINLTGTGLQDTPTVTLSTNPNPSTFGQSVTLSSTVTGNGSTPTGTVSFYQMGTTQTANLSATVTTATSAQTFNLAAGTYEITLPGTAGGGTYNGWNQSANPTTNNLWTDRYGIQLCATCATNIINLPGNPGYATDTAAISAFQSAPQLVNGTTATGNPYIFTLTSAQAVTLSVPDPGSFGDDSGGLSLNVTPLTLVGTGTLGTGTTNAAATATTTTLPVGTDPLVAVYNGDANHVSALSPVVQQVVNKAGGANTDTLTVSPNPSTQGATVTLTDSIPSFNGACPTGAVTFVNGSGTVLATGSTPVVPTPATTPATCVSTATTTALPAGATNITADLATDTNYLASTSNTVAANVTGAALTASPATGDAYGTPVTLTDTIAAINNACPTGATFTNTSTTPATTLNMAPAAFTLTNNNTSCVATYTTTALPMGTDALTATTLASGAFPATSAPLSYTVAKAPITNPNFPALSQSFTATTNPGTNPTTSTFGSPVILTYTIPVAAGNTAPNGTVTFTYSASNLGTCGPLTAGTTANGVTPYSCSTTTAVLPAGNDTVTATYSTTDPNYAGGATALTAPVVVTNPATTLTANPTSTTFGSPVTLTETIPQENGACPTGPATFSNGSTTLGMGTIAASGSSCVATLTTSNLPVGTNQVTVTIPASNGFGAINSGPTPVTTAVVNPSSVLGYGPQSPTCGMTLVTLTDTITTVNGVTPTGTVQFYTNLGPLGTPQTVLNGVATLTIAVPCGAQSTYGVYTGNSPYGTSTTPTASITAADFSIMATPPTQTINPGDTVVYTVSLTGVGGPFTSPVTLTATGLPADATVTFGTPTYVPGAGPTPTSMTIVTSPLHAQAEPAGLGPKIFYGLLLLPLLGVRRLRRKIRSLPKGIVYGLAALMMLGGLGAITGCAGGYFGGAGNTYTITVTGTSGTLSHSTTVTLTVR